MIRCPEGSSDRDAARWLQSIFLYGDKKIPYRLYQVRDGIIYGLELNKENKTPIPCVMTECYAHWPELGNFNIKGDVYAVHISRHAMRLWNRSLNLEMISIRKLDLFPGRQILSPETYITTPYVHAPFITPDAAIGMLSRGERESCAIDRRIALGRGLCTYKMPLFVDGLLSGLVVEGESIQVYSPATRLLVSKVFGDKYVVHEVPN